MTHGKRTIGLLTSNVIQHLSKITSNIEHLKIKNIVLQCVLNSEDMLSLIELVIHFDIDVDPLGAFQKQMS